MNIHDLQYRYQIKRTADSQFFTGRVKNVSIDNNNFISDICDCQLYIRKDSTGAYRYDCSNRIKCDRGSGRFLDIQRICKQQRDSVRWNVCSRTGTF